MPNNQYHAPHTGHPSGWSPPPASHFGLSVQSAPASSSHAPSSAPIAASTAQRPISHGPHPFIPAVGRRDGVVGLAFGLLLVALVFAAALAMEAKLPGYQPEPAQVQVGGTAVTPATPVERINPG